MLKLAAFVSISVLFLFAPAATPYADADAIREKLDKAIREYESAIGDLQRKVVEDLDRKDDLLRKRRVLDIAGIEYIVAEREAFLERGQIPESVDRKLANDLRKVRQTLEREFVSARDAYIRNKLDTQAQNLNRELKQILREAPPDEENAVYLFDGFSLAGWEPKNGNLCYAVDNGHLVYIAPGGRGRLQSKDAYSNFALRLEYQFPRRPLPTAADRTGILLLSVGSGNNVAGLSARGALEYQLKPGETGKLRVLEGKDSDDSALARKDVAERPPGIWNDVEIRFEGNNLSYFLNGKLVNHARLEFPRPSHIALRNGCEIRFRNIRLISPPPQESR